MELGQMSNNNRGTRSNRGTTAASQMLSELTKMAAPKKPKADTANLWELPLTPEAQETANRWANAKEIFDPIEKRLETERNAFNKYALRQVAEKLFREKTKPSNPVVITKRDDGREDNKFKWLLCDSFKLEFPKIPDEADNREFFVEFFTNLGLHPVDAGALVDNELEFCPVVGFRSLTEMLEGTFGKGREFVPASDEEKAAAVKLGALLKWDGTNPAPEPLTPEERELVIDRSPNATVRSGFLNRVANYARSVDQLMAIFGVIQPKVYPSYLDYAINDDAATKSARKQGALKDILSL
jgi:hypothetical protein